MELMFGCLFITAIIVCVLYSFFHPLHSANSVSFYLHPENSIVVLKF